MYREGFSWEGSTASVATVDHTGLVTAKGVGTATITVTQENLSAQCMVTVTEAAGLFDADGVMLASWDELVDTYGLNVGKDYRTSDCQTAPSSMYCVLENNNDTFSGGTKLVIGNEMTNIGSYAFYGCSALSSTVIPENVTKTGQHSFIFCSSLTDIYYSGTKEQWLRISFGVNWNTAAGDYTIHCSDGDIEKE